MNINEILHKNKTKIALLEFCNIFYKFEKRYPTLNEVFSFCGVSIPVNLDENVEMGENEINVLIEGLVRVEPKIRERSRERMSQKERAAAEAEAAANQEAMTALAGQKPAITVTPREVSGTIQRAETGIKEPTVVSVNDITSIAGQKRIQSLYPEKAAEIQDLINKRINTGEALNTNDIKLLSPSERAIYNKSRLAKLNSGAVEPGELTPHDFSLVVFDKVQNLKQQFQLGVPRTETKSKTEIVKEPVQPEVVPLPSGKVTKSKTSDTNLLDKPTSDTGTEIAEKGAGEKGEKDKRDKDKEEKDKRDKEEKDKRDKEDKDRRDREDRDRSRGGGGIGTLIGNIFGEIQTPKMTQDFSALGVAPGETLYGRIRKAMWTPFPSGSGGFYVTREVPVSSQGLAEDLADTSTVKPSELIIRDPEKYDSNVFKYVLKSLVRKSFYDPNLKRFVTKEEPKASDILSQAKPSVGSITENKLPPRESLQRKLNKQKYKVVYVQDGKKVEVFAGSIRGVRRVVYGKKQFRVYNSSGSDLTGYFKKLLTKNN